MDGDRRRNTLRFGSLKFYRRARHERRVVPDMSDDPLVPAAPPLHISDDRRPGFAFMTWRDALVDAFEGVDRAYERRQQMVQAAYDAGVSFRAIGEAVGRSAGSVHKIIGAQGGKSADEILDSPILRPGDMP